MNTKLSSWLIILFAFLFGLFVLDVSAVYAQEDEVVITQVFSVRTPGDSINAANTNEQSCEVTAELRWYKKKVVKVFYHWQACTGANTIHWEIGSLHNASGDLAVSEGAGTKLVYNESWPELTAGDIITLRTWINGVRQADVVADYQELAPIWTQIHTRADDAGACFQFTGHVDPWGVFTAGDYSYVFHLSDKDWETPWLEGPNTPSVDWHVQFYRDANLTQLRTEYWFNNVDNPCHTTQTTTCDNVVLSIPNGTVIPNEGANVQVTIIGQNGSQYQIVDPNGKVMVGPTADNVVSFHAMPDIIYQAQVYSERDGWTTAGCQFEYGKTTILQPACTGVAPNPATTEPISINGQDVQVTITGENASHYRIVDAAGNEVVAPSTSNVLSLYAMPFIVYQAQVYNEAYGWTNTGCQFEYFPLEIGTACVSVALVPDSAIIPLDGTDVQVTITAENATQYRIVQRNGTVVVEASTSNLLSMYAMPFIEYQAEVYSQEFGWITSQGCQFKYIPELPKCENIVLSIPNGASIPKTGADVQVTIIGKNATQYRLVDGAGTEVDASGAANILSFHAMPGITYQAQVKNEASAWTKTGCQFSYNSAQLVCNEVALSIPNGAVISASGAAVEVTIAAENASRYRIVDSNGAIIAGPSDTPVLQIHALPYVVYQAQVADTSEQWTTHGCQFQYGAEPPTCDGVTSNPPDGAVIAASGADVEVTIAGQRATQYQIVDDSGNVMAGPSAANTMHLHAMPGKSYQAQVANEHYGWTTSGCQVRFTSEISQQLTCTLRATHYDDPGGRSWITARIEGKTEPVAIERIQINWDNHKTVTYPTKRQTGPWFTNSEFMLDSRPEVYDVGFGYYKFEAWVYVAGFDTPAYCWSDGTAPDHDNVAPDPGPFAKANPEGKFNRGNTPSRLPTVGRLPFDGGNGPDKVELILWAFEKEGRGVNTHITAIANEGKPLARLGMESVSSFVKFDGLIAREGIVYGFQIGEHGPWSPLFCPKPDNNPTTITVYWAAGGQTWLSDGAAYSDCWWLTVAAALNGWVTVDESVATYNALQPVINWNEHRNLVFSLAQSKETGLGPRMQDAVIGLQARQWQGPVIPEQLPTDFWATVEAYRNAQ